MSTPNLQRLSYVVLVVALQCGLDEPVIAQSTLAQRQFADLAVSVEARTNSGGEFQVVALSNSQSPTIEVVLPRILAGYDSIHRWEQNRLAIVGRVQSGHVIYVIDVSAAALIDTFYAVRPAVSSDGRWIAFAKYVSRADQEDIGAVYLIYDLSRTPDQNRMLAGDLGVSREVYAGIAVYPDFNKSSRSYSGKLVDVGEYHGLSSPIVWLDERSFVFLDHAAQSVFAVSVAIGSDGSASSRKVALDVGVLAKSSGVSTPEVAAGSIKARAIVPLAVSPTTCRVRFLFTESVAIPVLEVEW